MKLLVLRLEGALQSWGVQSRWDHRDTAAFPTKSGVIGLLGCAFGYGRGDERLSQLADAIRFAVRADRPGSFMSDFHTVQGRIGKMLNAEGKPRGDTILTPRDYLEDACFTVFLEAETAVLEACRQALLHPIWTPYLGRKSCPPSSPLLPVICDAYDSLEDAVHSFCWPDAPRRDSSDPMLAEVEDAHGEGIRWDHPIDAAHNRYASRHVSKVTIGGR